MHHASGAVLASIVVAIGAWSSAAHAQRLVGWGFSGSSNTDRAQPALKAAAGLYHSMAVLDAPAQPADLGTVVQIDCGKDHVVALRKDGTVRVWGTTGYGTNTLPTGLGRVVQIAAGGAEVVVLQAGCAQDLSGDGMVNGADLARLLTAWSQTGTGLAADLNGDGMVDGVDLGAMLEAWGACSG